ncbi:aminoglycoside phosphotransferase family protein [Candidatus Woesebacteria bacterium]|nr:aminoglycoside phosphotransferase family protein [Candidatus Woesebacteria bacterium]
MFFEDEDVNLKRSVLILSEIEGKPISEYPNSAARDNALLEAGRDLAKINEVKIDSYGYVNFTKGIYTMGGDFKSLEEFAMAGTIEGLEELYNLGLISKETREKCRRILERSKQYLVADFPHLLHGDFGGRHIFFDGNSYTGILDFGDIRGGSQYHDLAHLRAFYPDIFETVLKGYQGYTKLPKNVKQIIAFESMLILLSKINWIVQHKIERLNKYKWVGHYIDEQVDFLFHN